jgi:glyoxylase-like metal-dependent hydrolase (beta-lactamase superfamily II)
MASLDRHPFLAYVSPVATAKIPIEDNYGDILGKAQRGLKLSDTALASKAGVSENALAGLRSGKKDEPVLRPVAQALNLNADALLVSARQSWYPVDPLPINGFDIFNTPFEDMTVNSYLVFDPQTKVAAAFDTGADCTGMLDSIREHGLKLELILITHIHGDHIIDLNRLKEKTGAPAFVSDREPIKGAEPFPDGREFRVGRLRIETRRTSGHSRGGVTYVVTGLAKRLAVVGDAMFAGSMGGGMVSFEEALQTNRENILSLPDDTVICPGHGPLTTVGEEKQHNPFYS